MIHSGKQRLIYGVIPSVLIVLMSTLQPAFAQFTKESLTIDVSKSGQAQVTEEINAKTTVSRISVQAIDTNITNVLASDQNNILLSTSYDSGTITIDTLGSSHVTLTYGAQIVTKISSDMWELSYQGSEIQSTIVLPSGSDIIYVDNIPIDINENVLTMPPAGELITVRYKIKSLATNNFVASWEDTDYFVQVVTASKINNFNFDQPSKAIVLTLDPGQTVLAIVPKSLLGGPYLVEDTGGSPLSFRQYYQNSTHSWIRIEASNSDTIKIIGTTVVPEFPMSLIVMAAAIGSTVAIMAIAKRRISSFKK